MYLSVNLKQNVDNKSMNTMKGSEILHQTLVRHTKANKEHLSIIETQTDKKITYFELLSSILSFQNFLGAKSKTIILATPGGIINSIVWLTSLIFGHFLIPISPDTTEFEFKEVLHKHTPDFIITENKNLITQPTIRHLTLTDMQSIVDTYKSDPQEMPVIHDGTVYLETSGSTGKPKGIILTASQIVITATNIKNMHELTNKDRGFTPLPFYHVNAPIVSLVSSLLAGATIIIAPKFSASHFWEQVEKYNPTWISVVPTIVAILLKFDKPDFFKRSSIRFFRTGSSPLPKINLLRFEEKIGLPLIETYGISEAASAIFMNPLPPKRHKPGSVGLPLLQVEIINTKTGEKVPTGEIGEICIKGDQVIDHYEENRGKDSFKNGWFVTGDLGYFDEDGYLFLTGRKKELIIRGGENIIPREIEEVLITYPEIVDVAVVGKPDSILGEKVVAFIVAKNKNKKDLIENIKKFTLNKLSPQKVPTEIYILDKLPRGGLNKTDKNALKKMASGE